MDFIRRRLSMNPDSEAKAEEKTKFEKVEDEKPDESASAAEPHPTLFESFSTKPSTLWNGFTSRMKSDRTTPNGSDIEQQPTPTNNKPDGLTFMESVKLKLKQVHRQYERTNVDSEDEDRSAQDVECAPLINTDDNEDRHSVVDTDNATTHSDAAAAVEPSAADSRDAGPRRKKLTKRQDSFTAEEIYLDTVAAKVKSGLVPPEPVDSNLVSPSKAVKEFVFTDASSAKPRPKPKQKKPVPYNNNNRLTVDNSNLINFDSIQNLSSAAAQSAEVIVHREDDHVFDYESSGGESSEPVYTEFAGRRSESIDSLQSMESTAYDEESKELREFSRQFVDNIFSDGSNSNEDKAKFGKCVQDGNFRLDFARAVSEKRTGTKAVSEHTFYQLVQYFAVVLFECEEADDFTPAMILMNMCFTFYYDSVRAGVPEKNYLFTYLKNQPIWQSMRYWNAAFYEAVQKERNRKPLTTNKADADDEKLDRHFQENIIFGQLGTFLHNMKEFGLSFEWCMEFLRKQATIGNLSQEQITMLKECTEMESTSSSNPVRNGYCH